MSVEDFSDLITLWKIECVAKSCSRQKSPFLSGTVCEVSAVRGVGGLPLPSVVGLNFMSVPSLLL